MTQSKTLTRLLSAAGAAILALVLLAPAAQAAKTAPGYERYNGCPTPAESPGTPICVRSDVTGGHLQMGKKNVPIENPLVLSGGVDFSFEHFTAGPEGGLSKTKQKVPGGLVGLTGLTFLLELFGSEALTLYAVTELTGPPTGFNFESVTFPIKVHLINSLIGNNCYIGSNSSPITLHLITGTTNPPAPNKPITGKAPTVTEDTEKSIVHANEGIFVDNSFAVPGANGCTLSLFGIPISINGFINEQAGLPSPAGTNEAVNDFNLEFTLQELVYP